VTNVPAPDTSREQRAGDTLHDWASAFVLQILQCTTPGAAHKRQVPMCQDITVLPQLASAPLTRALTSPWAEERVPAPGQSVRGHRWQDGTGFLEVRNPHESGFRRERAPRGFQREIRAGLDNRPKTRSPRFPGRALAGVFSWRNTRRESRKRPRRIRSEWSRPAKGVTLAIPQPISDASGRKKSQRSDGI
jgi:hypothetical protein